MRRRRAGWLILLAGLGLALGACASYQTGQSRPGARRQIADERRFWRAARPYARTTGSDTFWKKSFPLSSTRMKAGKSRTSIR